MRYSYPMDMWALACVVYELYTSQVRPLGGFTQQLSATALLLTVTALRLRLRFVNCCCRHFALLLSAASRKLYVTATVAFHCGTFTRRCWTNGECVGRCRQLCLAPRLRPRLTVRTLDTGH